MVASSPAVAKRSPYFVEKETAMTLAVWLSAIGMEFMLERFTR
jgi:hypothetical protein